jgi:hypothetical protein
LSCGTTRGNRRGISQSRAMTKKRHADRRRASPLNKVLPPRAATGLDCGGQGTSSQRPRLTSAARRGVNPDEMSALARRVDAPDPDRRHRLNSTRARRGGGSQSACLSEASVLKKSLIANRNRAVTTSRITFPEKTDRCPSGLSSRDTRFPDRSRQLSRPDGPVLSVAIRLN